MHQLEIKVLDIVDARCSHDENVACLEILSLIFFSGRINESRQSVSVEMRTGHLQVTDSDRQCSNQLAELFS